MIPQKISRTSDCVERPVPHLNLSKKLIIIPAHPSALSVLENNEMVASTISNH